MTLDFVVAKMRNMSGSRFDPKVVEAFLAAVSAGDITPPGQQTTNEMAKQEVS